MAKNHGNSIKDDAKYEALRDKGMSKEKAARIANTKDASERGGESPAYEERTKKQLYTLARKIGIRGRSKMTRDELISVLRNH